MQFTTGVVGIDEQPLSGELYPTVQLSYINTSTAVRTGLLSITPDNVPLKLHSMCNTLVVL